MVTIEELQREQFDTVARWLSDPSKNCWLSSEWRNKTVNPSLIAIALRNKRNKFFMVRSDGEPCGLVALSDIDPDDGTAMVWYVLGEDRFAGRGITSEAVRQLAAWAFKYLKLFSIYAWAMENNAASRKVLVKSGFREVGRLRRSCYWSGQHVDRVYFDLLPGESVAL